MFTYAQPLSEFKYFHPCMTLTCIKIFIDLKNSYVMEYFSVMPLFDKNCILYGHYSILASTILEYDIKPMILLVAYKYIIKTFT